MKTTQNEDNIKKQKIIELTSFMIHKHYCENDVESVVNLFDEQLSWFGAGEDEYATDAQTIAEIFRTFAGVIPTCTISDEQYHVIEITPDVYLCTGRAWIATDPATKMYLRVHQRITTIFRWVQDNPRCCHIHISNPYLEMTENELGFPTQMGQQSFEYLQECIEQQKKQIESQTTLLERMSFEDSLTGLFNRNKFNQIIESYESQLNRPLGVAYFDINGLKKINDNLGHRAGDDVICRTAGHINKFFNGKAFRIGGDEFAIIDEESSESDFINAITAVCNSLSHDELSSAVGICWRQNNCNIQAQFDEADKLMYQHKIQFYNMQ